MRKYLLDTNVLSEIKKGAGGDQGVFTWYSSIEESNLFISVISLGEILRGVVLIQHKDPVKSKFINAWYCDLVLRFSERIIGIDQHTMETWAKLPCRRTIPPFDSLLAATASSKGFIMVTRNVVDFLDTGVEVLNPFSAAPQSIR